MKTRTVFLLKRRPVTELIKDSSGKVQAWATYDNQTMRFRFATRHTLDDGSRVYTKRELRFKWSAWHYILLQSALLLLVGAMGVADNHATESTATFAGNLFVLVLASFMCGASVSGLFFERLLR